MLLIQLTGLSGAGKTSIANSAKSILESNNISVEIIDGDIFRKTFCKDLGFSKEDRCENIRRMGKRAASLSHQFKVIIIAAINPYNEIRNELEEKYKAKTVLINCELSELIKRDTKGLYARALLHKDDPKKIWNLTGVNDPYEVPLNPRLIINTDNETLQKSANKFLEFIEENLLQS